MKLNINKLLRVLYYTSLISSLSIDSNAQTISIISTDTSQITISYDKKTDTYYSNNRLNDIFISYCSELYSDTVSIKREGKRFYDSNIGKWHYYTRKGKHYKTIDYATLSRQLIDTVFIYEDYWRSVRQKADSIVMSYYSAEFFDAHIKLDANNTTWKTKTNEGLWFEMFDSKPSSFQMAYLIMVSQNHGFRFIEFELDSIDGLVATFRNKGLYNINRCCFNIDDKKIKQIIQDTKLEEESGSEWVLEWNEKKQDLEIRISNSRFIEYEGRMVLKSRTIYINPWSCEFSDINEEINEVIM